MKIIWISKYSKILGKVYLFTVEYKNFYFHKIIYLYESKSFCLFALVYKMFFLQKTYPIIKVTNNERDREKREKVGKRIKWKRRREFSKPRNAN